MSERRDARGPNQEHDNVAGRPAAGWWVGTVVVIAACAVISFALIHWIGLGRNEPVRANGVGNGRPLYTMTTHANVPDSALRERMESYRWVDRDADVVAVPIGVAMRLLAGRSDATSAGAK